MGCKYGAVRAIVLAFASMTIGCGFAEQVLVPVEVQHPLIHVMGVLDPARDQQILLVKSTDASASLVGWSAVLRDEGSAFHGRAVDDGSCVDAFGTIISFSEFLCIAFDLRPVALAHYRLELVVPGHDSVSAETVIPGSFRILDVAAAGEPPGSQGVTATWSTSARAHRYFLMMRPAVPPPCEDIRGCELGWIQAVSDTTVETLIDAKRLEGGTGPWLFEVQAVDAGFFEFATTGSGGGLMPIQPIQNVVGGKGFLGARNRRTASVGGGD